MIFLHLNLLSLLLIFCCRNVVGHSIEDYGSLHSNQLDFTLIGANGDLAKKYLWKGIFNLYQKYSENWNFTIHGAGTSGNKIGELNLNAMLDTVITCSDRDVRCNKHRSSFLNKVVYTQLKDREDYASYCEHLADSASEGHCHNEHSCRYQHIVYLSVPPFAYENIMEFISLYCRPAEGTGSLKVVFEKPFGHNKKSATALALNISKHLFDNEVYRVDHYLGKQAVQQIIPFRQENDKIEKMLNSRNVERIEIVMKETIGVRGRTKFYDRYGVICDVMQNHLSEILYLITMKLPIRSGNQSLTDVIDINKLKLLQQIKPVSKHDVVLGQYEDYQEEVQVESLDSSLTTLTPTFAGIKLKINSFRWRNIPVLMVAGKMLDERTSYARIVFKETSFQVSSNQECSLCQEVIFHIGHGNIGIPAILVTRNLPLDINYIPDGWTKTEMFDETAYFHSKLKCYHVFVPKAVTGAYTFLIEQTFLGHQENFLTRQALLNSWNVWGAIVNHQNSNKFIQLYAGGRKLNSLLDFQYANNELTFDNMRQKATNQRIIVQHKWLGNHSMITGEELGVIATLAEDIRAAAVETVANGRDFHIAFSGGSSPLQLFEYMSVFMDDEIPWENVNIWQVDERCTTNHTHLNFEALSRSLIDNIQFLKFKNIHAMPVSTFFHAQCTDEAAQLYENQLHSVFNGDVILDYILLGMGSDGHTASLFPYNAALREKSRLIAIANEVPVEVSSKRMTMTYPTLNSAARIGILVAGETKCKMLNILKKSQCDGDSSYIEYPICGISPSRTHVTWYISADCDEKFYF